MNVDEKLIQFKKFYEQNPYDFSEEEFNKVRVDIVNSRNGIVHDEYVDFSLWLKGLKSRHSYFIDYVIDKFPITKYKKILEVGCGRNPRVSKELLKRGYIMTAIDPRISNYNKTVISKKDERVDAKTNVNYISSEFVFGETDISVYDAVIAQEPCEATEHIVRACVSEKKDFIISLCGTPHRLVSGKMPKDLNEWYDYLEEIGGENCFIINSKMIPGYFCPVMLGLFNELI